MNNTLYTTSAPHDNGLYNHTHHGQHNTTTQQLPPPIYSTLAEGGAPADYSVITERERLAGYTMIGDTAKVPHETFEKETTGDYSVIELCEDNHTYPGHTAPPPIYSTLAEGGAPADYSVITEPQDTSDGGMVYSAVVRKDCKKTTVKTTAQTSSTSDTVQPVDVIEGMVYSAVMRQDGKKTTVKTTFLKDSSDKTTL